MLSLCEASETPRRVVSLWPAITRFFRPQFARLEFTRKQLNHLRYFGLQSYFYVITMSEELGNQIQGMFKSIYDAADLKYLRPLKVCIINAMAQANASLSPNTNSRN